MASSSTNPFPNYPYPSEFNVSDLVPDKLSKSNYSEWKPLMLDFIESRGMDEFIHPSDEDIEYPYVDKDYKERSWRKSDGLVRTWILSRLNKDIIKQVLPCKTAGEVWMALDTMFGPRKAPQPGSSYMKSEEMVDKMLGSYLPLHIMAIQGDSQSAEKFILSEPEAIRNPISTERETILITAVRSVRRNTLVNTLVQHLPEEDLAQADSLGRTALHVAAEVGNLEAARMLVKRNPDLLNNTDENRQTPLLYAAKTGNREMVRFLLKCVELFTQKKYVEGSGVLETGPAAPTLLYHLANSGLYDIALELLQQDSTLARTDPSMSASTETSPLMAMSQKRSSFRSGTPLNSIQKLIYSIAPVKSINTATQNPAEQSLVVKENPHNDTVNPAVNENRQNLPANTDTGNSVVDENPQNVAVNPVNQQNHVAITVNENLENAAVNPAVNENLQNLSANTDTGNSAVDENPQNVVVNPVNQQNHVAIIVNENLENAAINLVVNENLHNPPTVTYTENSIVDENPQNVVINHVNQQNHVAIIVNENLENAAVNSVVNENLQNPPTVTDTENSVVDENPQNVAAIPVVNENRQNHLAITDDSIVSENLQNAAVNSVVNENLENPPVVTDTENFVVHENPQNGAVNPVVNENQQNPLAVTKNSIGNENLQNVAATENPTEHREGNTENSANRENPAENLQSPVDTENLANTENPVENLQNYTENPANRENPNPESPQNLPQNLAVNENPHIDAVNPVVDENRQNPPAITGTENSIVDQNPQHVAVNPVVNENLQNAAVNPVVNENRQNHPVVTEISPVVDEKPQNGAVNPVANENQQNPLAVVTGGLHAMLWHWAENFVPQAKHIIETKLKHHQALELVKCLCKEIVKSDFSNATWIFTPALAQATSSGIHELVEEILRSYPAAISLQNENKQSIFQSAIVWRHENVFNLIYQLPECSHMFLSVPDRFGNNALHLAGCLGPQQHVSVRVSAAGAALQMQRELQWFKEVEKFALPQDKEHRNADGMTPAEVFTKTHKELIEAGERWMKDTASSCTIVAALIATVMFAAAITVPGGSNTNSGVSIFANQKAFIIFGLFDALALFTSIASLLMFLSILTARYAEEDFLYSLPTRLIIGLVNLFLSISSTMTAFGATLYLMWGENAPWIIYPIVAFACIPVTLFAFLQFPLLVVMYKSTYHPAIFGKQSDHMLF